jgi:hypothetical protein
MNSAEVEHIYTPVEALPKNLRQLFPNGAAVVFADEELTAAIPASGKEFKELADLMEIASAGEVTASEPAIKAYTELRDKLCGEMSYLQITALFKQEMDKEFNRDTKLASAARNN